MLLKPQIADGGVRAISSMPAVLTRSNIQHLYIQVFALNKATFVPVVDGNNLPLAVDLDQAHLDDAVQFSNLTVNTTYRIVCTAYKAPGTASADVISTADARSYTDVTVTSSDPNNPTIAMLKVRLSDVLYDSKIFVPDLQVTDGTVTHTGQTVIYEGNATVTTLAGSTAGYVDGIGASASFDTPFGLALDTSGNVLVSDSGNQAIRTVTASGSVSTLVSFAVNGGSTSNPRRAPDGFIDGLAYQGNIGLLMAGSQFSQVLFRPVGTSSATMSVFSGSGELGWQDGLATTSFYNQPTGIVSDGTGSFYVADTFNNMVRYLTSDGYCYSISTSNDVGNVDGPIWAARFNHPTGLALDTQGVLYVADTGNHAIRMVDPQGNVTTLAGSGNFGDADGVGRNASFDGPTGIAVSSSGIVYVADTNNNCIRKITPSGFVTTIAGTGYEGKQDGSGSKASFLAPSGLALNDSTHVLYVADSGNHRIRKIALQ